MGLVDWKMTRVWENHSLVCANHPSLWRNECAVSYKWSKEAHPTWQNIESMVWTSLNATFRNKLDPSFYSLMTKSKEKVEQSAEFWDTHSLCLKQLRSFCPRQLNWRSKSTWFQFPQPSIQLIGPMCCQLTVTIAVRPGITEPDFKPLGKLKMPAPMRFFVRFILAREVERQVLEHANDQWRERCCMKIYIYIMIYISHWINILYNLIVFLYILNICPYVI